MARGLAVAFSMIVAILAIIFAIWIFLGTSGHILVGLLALISGGALFTTGLVLARG